MKFAQESSDRATVSNFQLFTVTKLYTIRYTMQLSACNIERSKYVQADSSNLAVGYNPFNSCILINKQ
jgi:hypothetical protein